MENGLQLIVTRVGEYHLLLPGAYIFLTKTTAAQKEVAISYYRVRGLYFQAVVFAATIFNLPLFVISHST